MVEILRVEGSNNIEAIEYDRELRELVVDFKSGGRYRYSDVDGGEFEHFKDAESKGRYFAQNIKGIYSYTKER